MNVSLTPLVQRLLFVNVAVFLVQSFGFDQAVVNFLGLHYPGSGGFYPMQPLTYMFVHGDLGHLFNNMLTLFFFGPILERFWGGKRFAQYYFITGIGAGLLYMLFKFVEFQYKAQGYQLELSQINELMPSYFGVLIGASGAIFGILAAFAYLFPNTEMSLLFLPVPIKAKYMVAIFMLIELTQGVRAVAGDNVAHVAHIAGAVVGIITIKIWGRNRNRFY
jgi:membrane associated rhomboid family serine protease